MADVVSNTTTLKFDLLFVDGDTRILTLKNPKRTIDTSEITELQTFMRTNNIVVGDKDGGTFGRINKVTKINDYKTYLDINNSELNEQQP